MTTQYAFFKGDIVPIEDAKISIMTQAFNYGTAAFGGMRGYWNEDNGQMYLFRLDLHFERLLYSGKMMLSEIPYDAEQLCDFTIRLVRKEEFRQDIYLRPIIYKSQEGLGVRLHDVPSDFCMFAVPSLTFADPYKGLSVGFSSWRRISDDAMPARAKFTGSYLNPAFSFSEAQLNGFDNALVLNAEGHVAESSFANFFILRHGKVITPPVNADILEGITRRSMIELIQEELGLEVEERPIDRTETYVADEAFVCGTGIKIAGITSIDHRKVADGELGPVTKELTELFFDVVYGRNPKYMPWLTPVY